MAARKQISPRQRKNWNSAARRNSELPALLRRLGARVRVLRLEHGLTQEQLGAEAQLDPKHLQDIEGGRVNPTVATLVGITKALETTLAELFNGV